MRDQTLKPSLTLSRLTDNATLVVTVLLLFDSMHFIFARLLLPYLPPVSGSFYMIGLATLEVALYLAWRRQIDLNILRRHIWFFLSIGLLVAAATVLSFTSVRYVDAGTASLLSRTSVIFSLFLGIFWLKDQLRQGELIGAGVALAGVFVISFQPGDYLRLGSLVVLAGSFCYAMHTAITKRYGDEIDFGNFFLYRVGMTSTFLFFFAAGSRDLVWPSWAAWLILLIAATFGVVLSRSLYYLALRRLQMSNHAILLTLSPVVAIFWSFILFAEYPTWQSAAGGVLIIIGVMTMTYSRRSRV